MKIILSTFSFIAALTTVPALYAQIAPAIEWQKSLGGSANDYSNSIQQTTDGGYIVAGATSSIDGDVSGNNGTGDFWVVKLDGGGNLIWQKCLGGSGGEQAYSIQQTTDDGFIVAGSTLSNDGDVSGNHTVVYAPTLDYWVVKLDVDGNLIWQKCLGGFGSEWGPSIEQTSDGGYVVAGFSDSNDGDVSGNHGLEDYWVVKLDGDGNLVWQKSLGGSSNEYLQSIQQTTDGGFIISGRTFSNDGDVSGNHGYDDYWIVRLDSAGGLVWQKCLGGSNYDIAYSIQQITDGGFIVAGSSSSNDGDVTGNHGLGDVWIIKLDVDGNIVWQKSLGGSENDLTNSIQQTFNGGYIVAGYTESDDGDVSGNHGEGDYWIVKLEPEGNLLWQKCLGGSSYEGAFSIQQTADSGYVIAGRSASSDGDVTSNHGWQDYWIVKLAPDIATGISASTTNFISLFPNPTTSQLQITLPENYLSQQLKIANTLEQLLKQIEFSSNQISIDVSDLPTGVYFIELQNEKEKVVKKFVKQ